MISISNLLARHCQHTEMALNAAEIDQYLHIVNGTLDSKDTCWQVVNSAANIHIAKTYKFNNYYQTMAFINAIAFVIHNEDHHPEITFSYNQCTIKFDTHSVNNGKGGLSINDFICAAKVDAIYNPTTHHVNQ